MWNSTFLVETNKLSESCILDLEVIIGKNKQMLNFIRLSICSHNNCIKKKKKEKNMTSR